MIFFRNHTHTLNLNPNPNPNSNNSRHSMRGLIELFVCLVVSKLLNHNFNISTFKNIQCAIRDDHTLIDNKRFECTKILKEV